MAEVTYTLEVGQVFYLEKIGGVWVWVETVIDPTITFNDLDGDGLIDDGEIGSSNNDLGNLSGDGEIIALITSGTTATFYSSTIIIDPENYDFEAAMVSMGNNFENINIIICFAAGTKIETEHGQTDISDLTVGDMLVTRDNGLQPIRWIGSRTLSATQLEFQPHLRPITFKRGALADNTPSEDLSVSPQHRMLVDDFRADLLFAEPEVLVPAKGLVNNCSVVVDPTCNSVTYYHILCDTHELLLANGCWSESFHPGVEGLKAVDQAARQELFSIFPELEFSTIPPTLCRPSLTVTEGRALGNYSELLQPFA